MNILKKWFPVGTRSLLFGVHQFLWHPLTVGLAWRRIHKEWPTFREWICIAVHDIGYWGCDDMDGDCGKLHPIRGSVVAAALVGKWCRLKLWFFLFPALLSEPKAALSIAKSFLKAPRFIYWRFSGGINAHASREAATAFFMVRYHSRSLAQAENGPVSPLCAPDKMSVLYDPAWFYLLRGTLSGEIKEYRKNAEHIIGKQNSSTWLSWYKAYTTQKFSHLIK